MLQLLLIATTALPIVDAGAREVRFTATVQAGAMSRPFGVQGHHAIVWKEGGSRKWALFASDVSDHDVRVALDTLGATRGENLKPAAWTARDDPKNGEPDKRVEGSGIDVFIEWPAGTRIPFSELITEKGCARPAIDFRYGGHEAHQKIFESGCIVCLYSCPGGAIGNHAHPMRDYVRDGVVYASRPDRLPPDGTTVTVVLKLKDSVR